MPSAIQQIALMMEGMDFTSPAMGGSQAPAMAPMPGDSPISAYNGLNNNDDEEDQYSSEELKIAKRFMELMGSPERARDILDKCIEGVEYLGLVDDTGDEDMINQIGDSMNYEPDMPLRSPTSLSNQYGSGMNNY